MAVTVKHQIQITDRTITHDAVSCVSGNVAVDVCTITKDDTWDGLTLSLVWTGSGQRVEVSWDGTSDVIVPWEVLQKPGVVYLTLVGKSGSDVVKVTSVMSMPLTVVQAGESSGDEPSEATMTAIDKALSDAQTAATAAASSASEAASSEASAANCAQIARDLVSSQDGIVFSATEPPIAQRHDGMTWLVADMAALTFTVKRWDTSMASAAPYPTDTLYPADTLYPSPDGAWQAFKIAAAAQA